MKIELKQIKYSDWASEETSCFQANIYLNGKKVGFCNNDGKGGCTSYNRVTGISYEVINEMETYCEGLPPIVYESNLYKDGKCVIKMTLEHYLDDLFYDYLKAKDKAKMDKKMDKAILIGKENSYRIISFKMPLKDMWETHPQFFAQTLKESLNKYAVNGNILLNKNIPQKFLTI
jgi:hypothetical protein